jgi:hypothetical protein
MNKTIGEWLAVLVWSAVMFLVGAHYASASRYEVREVKDGNGNPAFLRLDLSNGSECAIGQGYAVLRHGPEGSTETYMVPFCK